MKNKIKSYIQIKKSNKNITILGLFVGVFSVIIEEIEAMKLAVDAKDVVKRDEHYHKITDILLKFAQGFREENPTDQEWGELIVPLMIHVREEIRRIRRYDVRSYPQFISMLSGLVGFWKEQDREKTMQNGQNKGPVKSEAGISWDVAEKTL